MLSYDERLRRYKAMVRIRMIEEAIADRYADQEMRCPVHLSIGQEAAAVGVCAVLRTSDLAFSGHRSHAHYLAKGGDLQRMLDEIHGKETGCCGGRGGSMHLMDDEVGFMASVPIVASSIPLAVGAALSRRHLKRDAIAVAFFGDAAVEEGVFHESANFAAVRKLPVLFACENNLYSVYTNLRDRQPDRPLEELGRAHGLRCERADGNDLEAIHGAVAPAVEHIRAGHGPAMVVLDTYRWREHCGPNYDNDLGYRTVDEFESWQIRCPVEAALAALTADGGWTAEQDARYRDEVAAEIDAAFERARATMLPDPATVGARIYAD